VASTLASIDLVLLIFIGLAVALIDTPVPRVWAIVAGVLLSIQAFAVHEMELQPFEPGAPRSEAIVNTTAEAVATLAVPALTAALLTVIFFHCARAYARAKRRLEASLRAQAIGSDMPTGWGAAGGSGSCMTGSSTGESATSPRAA
jgi:uncharacterized membrane protein